MADDSSSVATRTRTSASNNDRVYRKKAPEPKREQMRFPPRRKIVREKKATAKKQERHSLPASSSGGLADKTSTRKKKSAAVDEKKQSTLTQMRWVPSTFDGEDDEDGKPPFIDLSAGMSDDGEIKTKKSANRGRKRRKTDGDLELHGDEKESVSSSRFHTQTLTQMPSWRQEEELWDGFDDDDMALYQSAIETENRTKSMPPSNKRKRQSPPQVKPVHGKSAMEPPSQPSMASNAAILETPKKQIIQSVIPDSQPSDSPFTPVLASQQVPKCPTPGIPSVTRSSQRFWSPMTQGVDRTPLKAQSSNLEKSTPTASSKMPVPPRRTRSEIPDSYSTVNGGLSSSPAPAASPSLGRSAEKRQPLAEISLEEVANMSVELGEDVVERSVTGSRHSQELRRFDDEIIQDSDYESEAFVDEEDALKRPGTPSPRQLAVAGDVMGEGCVSEAPEVESGQKETSQESSPRRALLDDAVMDRAEEMVEILEDHDAQDVVRFTPLHKALREITKQTLEAEDIARASADLDTPTRSAPKPTTQQASSHNPAHRSSTPVPPTDEDDTELETPSRPRRRPSSSSAVDKETPLSSPHKTSPVMPAVSQLGYSYKSQAFESQRVPFEIIRQMAPQTDRSDVIITISAEDVKQIIEGTKTHEFRDFRLAGNVARLWIYIPQPLQELKYMATISEFKLPGDIAASDPGIGNTDFNEGKSTKYGYELKQVYQLNNPVSLERMMENGWVEQAPEKYEYVPPAVLGELMGNLRCALFEDHDYSEGPATISQELEEQIRSDVAHSTQLRKGLTSSPAQCPTQDPALDIVSSSQYPDMNGHVSATPPRTTNASSARQDGVFAKPSAPPSRSQRSIVQVEDSPPVTKRSQSQSQSQQYVVKATVRQSQVSTVGPSTQSQMPLPPQRARTTSDDVVVIDDSPLRARQVSSSGIHHNTGGHTQSSLGLGMLLRSSQGFGLAGIGGEQDSLMDDSRIPMPPEDGEVVWDSEPES